MYVCCVWIVVNPVGALHSFLRAHKKWFIFISTSLKKSYSSNNGCTSFAERCYIFPCIQLLLQKVEHKVCRGKESHHLVAIIVDSLHPHLWLALMFLFQSHLQKYMWLYYFNLRERKSQSVRLLNTSQDRRLIGEIYSKRSRETLAQSVCRSGGNMFRLLCSHTLSNGFREASHFRMTEEWQLGAELAPLELEQQMTVGRTSSN